MGIERTCKKTRVIGPPGTGKTQWIACEVERRISAGLLPEEIAICSFTKAAAAVAASRAQLPDENIGTIHAFGYRSIGAPKLVWRADTMHRWNSECWALYRAEMWPAAAVDIDSSIYDLQKTLFLVKNKSIFEQFQMLRAIDVELARKFEPDLHSQWESFKNTTFTVDFTDMLVRPVERQIAPPGKWRVLFVDEAQDLSPQQWQLLDHWSQWLDEIIVAGDPAQTIYTWAGATPAPLIGGDWDETIVLEKSHRLPDEIYWFAEQILSRHSDHDKFAALRQYQPAHTGGVIRRLPYCWNDYKMLWDDVAEKLREGLTVMVIASTNRVANAVAESAIRRGIIPHNPYRRSNRAWNPLRGETGDIRTVDRVRAFFGPCGPLHGLTGPFWETAAAEKWLPLIRAELLGGFDAKARALESLGANAIAAAIAAMSSADRDAALSRDPGWLIDAVQPKYRRKVKKLIDLAEPNWRLFTAETPDVIVGTIHSVKGGEADVVVLITEPSAVQASEIVSTKLRPFDSFLDRFAGSYGVSPMDEQYDQYIRMLYVGVTRSKRELWLPQMTQRKVRQLAQTGADRMPVFWDL